MRPARSCSSRSISLSEGQSYSESEDYNDDSFVDSECHGVERLDTAVKASETQVLPSLPKESLRNARIAGSSPVSRSGTRRLFNNGKEFLCHQADSSSSSRFPVGSAGSRHSRVELLDSSSSSVGFPSVKNASSVNANPDSQHLFTGTPSSSDSRRCSFLSPPAKVHTTTSAHGGSKSPRSPTQQQRNVGSPPPPLHSISAIQSTRLQAGLQFEEENEEIAADFLLDDISTMARDPKNRMTTLFGKRNELEKMRASAKWLVGRRAVRRYVSGFEMQTFVATPSTLTSQEMVRLVAFRVQLNSDSGFLMMTRRGRVIPKLFPLQQVMRIRCHSSVVDLFHQQQVADRERRVSSQTVGSLDLRLQESSPLNCKRIMHKSQFEGPKSQFATSKSQLAEMLRLRRRSNPRPMPVAEACKDATAEHADELASGATTDASTPTSWTSRQNSTTSCFAGRSRIDTLDLSQLPRNVRRDLQKPCAVLHLRTSEWPLVCLLSNTRKRDDFAKMIRFLQNYFFGHVLVEDDED